MVQGIKVTGCLMILLLLTAGHSWAQSECASGTGSNATYVFPATMEARLSGAALDSGDVVSAHNAAGDCVGRLVWTAGKSQAMAVWGDDVMTTAVDGMEPGEKITFQVTDLSTGQAHRSVQLTFAEGDATFKRGGIALVASLNTEADLLRLDLYVLLQGPYDPASKSMTAELSANGLLPLTQPFADPVFDGTPLDYDAAMTLPEGFFAAHPGVVDYVLVELRSGTETATIVARRPALLLKSGRVVDFDGTSAPAFEGVAPAPYYVLVRHRNHLAVMSAAAVDFSAGRGTYDFTTAQQKAYGANPMAALDGGRFGLYAGDANANGQVQDSDKMSHWWAQMGRGGYLQGDFNLNGQVQHSDKVHCWWPNVGKTETVP